LGYWIDHFLSHKVPFLWEFHKVHHSATVLTPLTNWRVHPVDTILFLNILALVIGSLQALADYGLGSHVAADIADGKNIFLVVYFYLYGHLQHSHVWMPFTGWAGRVFCSPAHHQIHHSTNPAHFDRNFGSSLSLFDWLFGTLTVPGKKREVTCVGVDDDAHLQRFTTSLTHPFWHALRRLVPARQPVQHSSNP